MIYSIWGRKTSIPFGSFQYSISFYPEFHPWAHVLTKVSPKSTRTRVQGCPLQLYLGWGEVKATWLSIIKRWMRKTWWLRSEPRSNVTDLKNLQFWTKVRNRMRSRHCSIDVTFFNRHTKQQHTFCKNTYKQKDAR